MGIFSKADDEHSYQVNIREDEKCYHVNIRDEALQIAKELEQSAKLEAEQTIKLERKVLEHKHRHELQLAEERKILAQKNEAFRKEQAALAESRRFAEQQRLIQEKRNRDKLALIESKLIATETHAKLMADIQSRDMTFLKITNDLMLCSQIDELTAKSIVNAVNNGLIPNLFINY